MTTTMDYAEGLRTALAIAQVHEEQADALEVAPIGWCVIRVPSPENEGSWLPPDGEDGLFYCGSRFFIGRFEAATGQVHYDDGTAGKIEDHDCDGWHPLPDTAPLVAMWWEARALAICEEPS